MKVSVSVLYYQIVSGIDLQISSYNGKIENSAEYYPFFDREGRHVFIIPADTREQLFQLIKIFR